MIYHAHVHRYSPCEYIYAYDMWILQPQLRYTVYLCCLVIKYFFVQNKKNTNYLFVCSNYLPTHTYTMHMCIYTSHMGVLMHLTHHCCDHMCVSCIVCVVSERIYFAPETKINWVCAVWAHPTPKKSKPMHTSTPYMYMYTYDMKLSRPNKCWTRNNFFSRTFLGAAWVVLDICARQSTKIARNQKIMFGPFR